MDPCVDELVVKDDISEQVDAAALKLKKLQPDWDPQLLWHSGK